MEIAKIKKSGNVTLDTTFDELKANGIEIGDTVTVKTADREQFDALAARFGQ